MILFLTLFTICSCLAMAGVVYLRKPHHPAYQSMALLNVCLATWTIANWFAVQPDVLQYQFFWVQTVMFVTAPIPWLFLRFVLYFVPLEKVWMKSLRHLLPFLLIWIILIMMLSYTQFMFSKYRFDNGWKMLSPGPGAFLYGVTFCVFSGIGVVTLLEAYQRQQGLIKLQILYVLFGLGLTVSVGFTTNFILVIFQHFELLQVGPFSALFLLGCVSYAMVKHRLLDLKWVIVKLLIYFLALVVVTNMVTLLWILIVQTVGNYWFERWQSWHIFIAVGATALLFPLVFQATQKVIQKLFRTSGLNTEAAYHDISKITAQTYEVRELIIKLDKCLQRHLNVETCGFLFQQKKYLTLKQLLEKMDQHNKPGAVIVFDELEETSLKNALRKEDMMICIPLQLNKMNLGWLSLSSKKSGNAFSVQELQFCQNIAPQISLALFHAKTHLAEQKSTYHLQRKIEKATHDLRQANVQLSKLDQLKDEFVSIASHELRTPMTAIRSYLWLCLHRSKEELPTTVKSHLTIAYSATERLLVLVKDLLTVSQIEGEQLKLHKQPTDMMKLIQDVVNELVVEATKKTVLIKIKVKETLTEKVPQHILCDQMKVTEILHNLIGNAIKFSPVGKKVVITLSTQKNNLRIAVRDYGGGIPDEQKQLLFQKFGIDHQTQYATSGQGTGLGLYIAQQFSRLHGGKIQVKSKISKGTLFCLYLPIEEVSTYE